jgi:NAD(P)-dependent dehydrogenase (short-subunit alcohol dehydrogenase family)
MWSATSRATRGTMADLTDKTVFVTGGGKGIGRAIALAFAQAGCDVAICGRDADALDAAAREIEAAGRRALALPADVSQETDVRRAVGQVLEVFGRIDILVNNAGQFLTKPFEEMTTDEWDRIVGVNLRGAFLVCKAVVPAMIERGAGHIFVIASVGGRRPMKHATAYCASKYGVVGFSKTLARELKPHGIKLQIAYPYRVASHGEVDWAAEDPKLTKWITPEELAAVLVENARRPHRVLVEDLVFEPAVEGRAKGNS